MKISENCYKLENTANPISPNVFCADPTGVEYNGRLYIYGTNDHQEYEAVGDDGKNGYAHIKSIVMLSTDDMVNWEYHGFIDVARIAPWIVNSWAPSIASRVEADGKTHFTFTFEQRLRCRSAYGGTPSRTVERPSRKAANLSEYAGA